MSGMVKKHRMTSEKARLRMKMFLVLAWTWLVTDATRMDMFPKRPATAKVI